MSVIHVEGFDNISTADLALLGYVIAGTVQSGAGRFGGAAFGRTAGVGTPVHWQKIIAANNVCTGMAYNTSTSFPGAFDCRVLTVTTDPAGISGALGATIYKSLTTNLFTFAVAGGIVGSMAVILNAWYYFEISVDSSGNAIFRVNGVQVAGGSNAALAGTKQRVTIGTTSTTSPEVWRADDWYIKDDTTFLGDSVVVTRYPTSDTLKNWTPLSGTDNYAMVDEVTEDGDTTYVSNATIGAQDYYLSNNAIPGTPVQIHAVGLRHFARKDDTATRQVRARLRSGVATAAGPTQTLGTTYTGQDSIYPTDPATGTAWTQSAVLATEFGPELVT